MLTDSTALFQDWNQLSWPHIWPGFSWHNLKKLAPLESYDSRDQGHFMWGKAVEAVSLGATQIFVGMFDEYDEATAVIPMTDDPPQPYEEWGHFITNEGKPKWWWLGLAGEAKRLMLGQRSSLDLPTVQELENLSNIGPEVSIALGSQVVTSGLLLSTAYANNVVTLADRSAYSTVPETGQPEGSPGYMGFTVQHSEFLSDGIPTQDVTVEIRYLDEKPGVEVTLQYDSTNDAWTNHPISFTTTGLDVFNTVRFEIQNARFTRRQNGGYDFRLRAAGGRLVVDRVWLRLPMCQWWTADADKLCGGDRRGSCQSDGSCACLDGYYGSYCHFPQGPPEDPPEDDLSDSSARWAEYTIFRQMCMFLVLLQLLW